MKSILAFVIVGLVFLPGHSKKEEVSGKVTIDYNVGINYVTHLYTLANIGFADEEYCNKYSHTVPLEDIKTLQKYQEYLRFENGKSGLLTSNFFFIPAYANLKNKSDYQQYSHDFAMAMKNKSCATVMKYLPDNQKESFCQLFSASDEEWQNILAVNKVFEEIMAIYVNNIDTYLKDVFPFVEKDLISRSEYLNNAVSKKNIVADWEEVTGYDWPLANKTYLLFRAGRMGPSFNNLSANVNTLYYQLDDDYTLDMFGHEFGIFLMFDSIMPIFHDFGNVYPQYESQTNVGRVNWMAFEMLATFFNCKISGHKTLDYYNFGNSDPIAFMAIYEKLYRNGITNPKDLYEQGVNEYMKPNGMWHTGVAERNNVFIKEVFMRQGKESAQKQ